MDVQYTHWNRAKGNLFILYQKDFECFFQSNVIARFLILINVAFFLLFLLYFFRMKTDKNIVLTAYVILTLLCIMSSYRIYQGDCAPPSVSFYRYYLGCFPFYLGIELSTKRFLCKKIIFFIWGLISFILSISFIASGWPF